MEGWEAPKWLRRALLVAGAVVLLVVLVLAFRPEPVSVDLATVSRGTVEVAVEEDGRTRVRDRYELAAPVAGSLRRIEVATVEAREEVRRQEVLTRQDAGSESALERALAMLRARKAEARVTRWGGEEELPARVRLVEPAGFTRISALGIEEQRVNVILDPVGDGTAWERLGDGFRVEGRILLEQASDVVRVPAGALFCRGDEWGASRAVDGRLEEVTVRIGRRSQAEVEVVGGLEEGDRVVVYPSDRVEDGARLEERSDT